MIMNTDQHQSTPWITCENLPALPMCACIQRVCLYKMAKHITPKYIDDPKHIPIMNNLGVQHKELQPHVQQCIEARFRDQIMLRTMFDVIHQSVPSCIPPLFPQLDWSQTPLARAKLRKIPRFGSKNL